MVSSGYEDQTATKDVRSTAVNSLPLKTLHTGGLTRAAEVWPAIWSITLHIAVMLHTATFLP